MRLGEARKAAVSQMDTLWKQKNKLTNLLKDPPKNDKNFDRVEISKKLDEVEKAYDLTAKELSEITTLKMYADAAETEKNHWEAMTKHMQEQMEYMMKCMEVYRRIAEGGKVPSTDEMRLMQYDPSLYVMAKSKAMQNHDKSGEQYKSLWADGEQKEQTNSLSSEELSERVSVSSTLPDVPHISMDISGESE